MDTNLPALTTQSEPGAVAAPGSAELSGGEVDALRRRTYSALLEAVHAPYVPHPDDEDDAHLAGKTKYEVMCLRVLDRATSKKCDMRAVEFLQEHMVGKAVQRVESQNVTVTYQDLLAKTAEAEKKYQREREKQERSVSTEDIVDAHVIPVSWDDLR